jgi:hypothetical protein
LQSVGVLLRRLVLSRSLPSCFPPARDARRRLPSRGSLGPRFPTFPVGGCLRLPSVLCSATTARHPFRVASLCARFPIPDPLPEFCVPVSGSRAGGSSHTRARAFGRPVPLSGDVARRWWALPRSRVAPVDACPALRPRWCPDPSPYRAQDCCLPATGNRRLSPLIRLEGLSS